MDVLRASGISFGGWKLPGKNGVPDTIDDALRTSLRYAGNFFTGSANLDVLLMLVTPESLVTRCFGLTRGMMKWSEEDSKVDLVVILYTLCIF